MCLWENHFMPVLPTPCATQASADPTEPPDLIGEVTDLADRLAQALPGDIIPYHIGMLAADRAPTNQALTADQHARLVDLASRMRQLADGGRVHLVQRRLGPERFAYLAIVRPQPRRAAGFVGLAEPDADTGRCARRRSAEQGPLPPIDAIASTPSPDPAPANLNHHLEIAS